MQSTVETPIPSGRRPWAGLILTALAAAFLLFDGTLHVLNPSPVIEASKQLGYPIAFARGIGVIELRCLVVYVVPATAVLGAILLTGYLGGAVASHVRVGHSAFETIFPVIVGALVWGGLCLRDARLRALLPLRRPTRIGSPVR